MKRLSTIWALRIGHDVAVMVVRRFISAGSCEGAAIEVYAFDTDVDLRAVDHLALSIGELT